ncbi:MAG: hypothetical protein RLZZ31_588 [Actinomycetota bacterium]
MRCRVESLDLSAPRHLHIIGVGGPGMSALAIALAEMGNHVSGVDVRESPALDAVRNAGVKVFLSHRRENLDGPIDAVIRSTAIALNHPEVEWARQSDIPVIDRGPVLAGMAKKVTTISVTGTHGKTTTSAMLAAILRVAGRNPSYVIGGIVDELGGNAHWGSGDVFVMESDESDASGFACTPFGVIVTNVEPDHLEFHGSLQNLESAYLRFVEKATGPRLFCADDEFLAANLSHATDSYGFGNKASVQLRQFTPSVDGTSFELWRDDQQLAAISLSMPGRHNALNATAAFLMATSLGVSRAEAENALAQFGGVQRRFQKVAEVNDIVIVDDFAHLCREIQVTIQAAQLGNYTRILTVFQPHRYSRTESLHAEFASAFVGSDLLVLTDVYAAGEEPRPGVDGRLILNDVKAAHPEQEVLYHADRSTLAEVVSELIQPGDICLTIGAGDISALGQEIADILAARA